MKLRSFVPAAAPPRPGQVECGGDPVHGRTGTGSGLAKKNEDVPSLLFLFVPLLLIVIGICVAVPYFNTPMPTVAAAGGSFDLKDGSGHAVTDRSWPGKFLLIYFGYTHCPAVCPTTLANMANALDELGRVADRVQPLFITVDPARDTPAVMSQYAAMFWPRLVGLTGSASQVARAAERYGIYYAPHRTGPGSNDYSMDHSSVVYLMTPGGGMAAIIDANQKGHAMAVTIADAMHARKPA